MEITRQNAPAILADCRAKIADLEEEQARAGSDPQLNPFDLEGSEWARLDEEIWALRSLARKALDVIWP